MKLAIIDLDGVVADPEARFKRAEEAKQAFLQEAESRFETVLHEGTTNKQAIDLYWRTVFTPELVSLDTPIEGAREAMNKLMEEGYLLIYLTSRPELMRWTTLAWLGDHDILHHVDGGNIVPIKLVMKPPAAQYVKTVVWKALTIQMLVSLYGAEEVLVVDDEAANMAELQKYDVSHMRLCSSLAEAIAPPPENDRPF